MRATLLAGLAGLVATVAPAHAHPTYHFEGECSFFTISDGTSSPQTRWDGEIHVVVHAVDAESTKPAAVRVEAACELLVNGAEPGEIVFEASGTAVAAAAGTFSYHAHPDDIVVMCERITVGGEYHRQCPNATPLGPIIPGAHVIESALRTVDDVACTAMTQVKDLPADPALLDVREDGDVYVAGEWVWDCPPYGTSGP